MHTAKSYLILVIVKFSDETRRTICKPYVSFSSEPILSSLSSRSFLRDSSSLCFSTSSLCKRWLVSSSVSQKAFHNNNHMHKTSHLMSKINQTSGPSLTPHRITIFLLHIAKGTICCRLLSLQISYGKQIS